MPNGTTKVEGGKYNLYIKIGFYLWLSLFNVCISGLSRNGKVRGPPGSKDLKTVLRGCEDLNFIDFLKR